MSMSRPSAAESRDTLVMTSCHRYKPRALLTLKAPTQAEICTSSEFWRGARLFLLLSNGGVQEVIAVVGTMAQSAAIEELYKNFGILADAGKDVAQVCEDEVGMILPLWYLKLRPSKRL